MADALGKLKTATGPWMAVAIIFVAAFMYWLYWESSQLQSESSAAADTASGGLPAVADTAFAANPQRFSGRRILLSPVKVQERLGRAALTLDLPEAGGYPVILDRPVLESEITIVRGDDVALAGWVYALNDSILNVWAQRNLYDPEFRSRLEGKTTFFLVDSLELVFPGEAESPSGAGGP